MPCCASSRYSGMPTLWRLSEGNTRCTASARCTRIPRGQRPRACTQAPCSGTGRSHVRLQKRELQTVWGSQRTYADDEWAWEVGQLHCTCELAEQSRGTGGGSEGGKGAGQGELARAQRAPDSEPGRRAQRAGAGTSSSNEGQETTVHCALPPHLRRRSTADSVPDNEEGCGRGRRRRDVGALRRDPRGESPGPLPETQARSVQSKAGA